MSSSTSERGALPSPRATRRQPQDRHRKLRRVNAGGRTADGPGAPLRAGGCSAAAAAGPARGGRLDGHGLISAHNNTYVGPPAVKIIIDRPEQNPSQSVNQQGRDGQLHQRHPAARNAKSAFGNKVSQGILSKLGVHLARREKVSSRAPLSGGISEIEEQHRAKGNHSLAERVGMSFEHPASLECIMNRVEGRRRSEGRS